MTATDDPQADHRRRDEAMLLLLVLGASLGWTDAQLVTLSAVNQQSIAKATSLWKSTMAPRYASLLTAGKWSEQNQTYEGTSGPLTASELKAVSVGFADAVADQLDRNTVPMTEGEKAIEAWQEETGGIVKSAIIAQTIFAAGGVDELKPRDAQAAADEVKFSLSKLERFAHLIELKDSGVGSRALILARVRLYAAATNKAYEKQRRVSHRRAVDKSGTLIFTEERNILTDADHCRTEGGIVGCLEETARGWRRIGSLTAPGERRCGMNCKCRLEFRKLP